MDFKGKKTVEGKRMKPKFLCAVVIAVVVSTLYLVTKSRIIQDRWIVFSAINASINSTIQGFTYSKHSLLSVSVSVSSTRFSNVEKATTLSQTPPRRSSSTSASSKNLTPSSNSSSIADRTEDTGPFPIDIRTNVPPYFNAPNVTKACSAGIRTLFFVHTAVSHADHRKFHRNSIGLPKLVKHFNWTTVFFTGTPNNPKDLKQLSIEAERTGDLVVLPYLDTYRNLTYKFIYGVKWVIDHCPDVNYIVKIDDDVLINVLMLEDYLNNKMSVKDFRFHCLVWYGMPVIRNPKSSWYVPKSLYPKDVYPTYCSGRAVIFSNPVLRPIYNASFHFPFYSVDDSYVTGDLALLTAVGHKNIDNLITFDEDLNLLVQGKFMFAHFSGNRYRKRLDAWNNMWKFYGRTKNITFLSQNT